jgi:hypothetical protein
MSQYKSRKELAETFGRSYHWARVVAKEVPNYGERFDVADVRRKLKAGFRPFRKK